MKEKYVKPEIYTDDVSIAFSGACCTEESDVDAVVGSFSPLICLPGCYKQLNSYQA